MVKFINISPPYSGIFKISKSYYYAIRERGIQAGWLNIKFDKRYIFEDFIDPPFSSVTSLAGNGYALNHLLNLIFRIDPTDPLPIVTSPNIMIKHIERALYIIHDFYWEEVGASDIPLITMINYKKIHNYIKRNSTPVITPSRYIAEVARRRGYNVLTPIYYHTIMSPMKNKTGNEKTIISVGTNDRRKRPDLILDFVNSLPEQYTFVRVGGDLSKIDGKELKPKCKFEYYQHITEEQLNSLYERASALFFPSEGEGLGLPILEAITHRVPVIVNSKLETAREIDYGMGTFIYFDKIRDIDLEMIENMKPDFDGWYKKYSEINNGYLNILLDYISKNQ